MASEAKTKAAAAVRKAQKKANKPADKDGGTWKWVESVADWVFSKFNQPRDSSPNATRARKMREAEEAANE